MHQLFGEIERIRGSYSRVGPSADELSEKWSKGVVLQNSPDATLKTYVVEPKNVETVEDMQSIARRAHRATCVPYKHNN